MMHVLLTVALVDFAVAGPLPWLPRDYPTIPMPGVEGAVDLPLVGLGTWQYNDSVAEAAVTSALQIGFRHIDTALGYNNQVGVGAALKKSPLLRDAYFVTSKIPGGLNASDTEANLDLALKQLGLDYVD